MRKYLIGFVVALVVVGVVQGVFYIQRLQAEAAQAHLQAQQGAQAFAYLATVLAKDKDGKAALTMGDALVQIVQAQLKSAQAAPPK
jgi:hypothetical protein